ncbi:MAG: PEP-CTERM sorting domain-containing protein, partial [Phycisphaerae bacterium]
VNWLAATAEIESIDIHPVPEPGLIVYLGLSAGILALRRNRTDRGYARRPDATASRLSNPISA